MRVKKSQPVGLDSSENFVLMGVVTHASKDYACLLDISKARETASKTKEISSISAIGQCLYIEEIHWSGIRGGSIETSTLHQIDNDEEWAALTQYVMTKTDIFSPKKINNILKYGVYYYSTDYMTRDETRKDYEERKKKGLA